MKIAWVMHGLSRSIAEHESRPNAGWNERIKMFTNYENSLENYKDRVFSSFKNIDVFFHTYNDDQLMKPKIISDYSPRNFKITPPYLETNRESNLFKKTNSRFFSILKSLECFEKNKEEYDLVICTRFDLHFEEDVSKLVKENFDKSKFLLGFRTESFPRTGHVDDNLFVFEPGKLEQFKKIIKEMKQNNVKGLHDFSNFTKQLFNEEVDYLFDGQYNINTSCPYYHIVRVVSSIGEEDWRLAKSPKNNKVENCQYCKI